MKIHTLKMFNTGQVTLPKSWRKRFKTEHFLAEETKGGLLLKPILQNEAVQEYETDQEFGVLFPKGMDAGEFLKALKTYDEQH